MCTALSQVMFPILDRSSRRWFLLVSPLAAPHRLGQVCRKDPRRVSHAGAHVPVLNITRLSSVCLLHHCHARAFTYSHYRWCCCHCLSSLLCKTCCYPYVHSHSLDCLSQPSSSSSSSASSSSVSCPRLSCHHKPVCVSMHEDERKNSFHHQDTIWHMANVSAIS